MDRKKKIIIAVSLCITIGVVVFLYVNSKKSNPVVLQNESVPTAENEIVEEKSDTVAEEVPVESSTPAPTPVKEEVVVPNDTPKSAERKPSAGKIVPRLVSFGFEKASGRTIDTVIIHSTYNALGGDQFSVEKIINIYKSYDVSPHYLIDRQGTIYQMVEDKNIAYHAGVAKLPDGRTNVNAASIGIEMINSKTDKFTAEQYVALNKLLGTLKDRYKIKYVLGHNQIAPGRKDDPWNFDWGLVE